jgi:hypothetical protein
MTAGRIDLAADLRAVDTLAGPDYSSVLEVTVGGADTRGRRSGASVTVNAPEASLRIEVAVVSGPDGGGRLTSLSPSAPSDRSGAARCSSGESLNTPT